MEKGKKTSLIAIAGVALILVMIVLLGHTSPDKATNKKEGDITRYEWIDLLCDYTGAVEYRDTTPYFKDVDKEDAHFNYIQSAVEWEYIEKGSKFHGDQIASGKFIALSAMKSIGEAKLQICLEMDKKLTDKEYLELAIENNLVKESDLKRGFSREEAEQVIEKLSGLYFDTFWPTDIEKITYCDDVIELSDADIVFYDKDNEEITVSNITAQKLNVGDIIVFNSKGSLAAKKIHSISDNGLYALETPQLKEVVNTFIESDIKEIGFQDILNYYGEENLVAAETEFSPQIIRASRTISSEITQKGFIIEAKINSDNELELYATDNDTGKKCKLSVSTKLSDKFKYLDIKLNVDSIFVGTQLVCEAPFDVKYVDIAVDIHSEFSGGISAGAEGKFPLFKIPTPMGNGIASVDIEFYLVISLDGTVTMQAEIPFQNIIHYEREKGIRSLKPDISVETPNIEASGELNLKLRLAPILSVVGIPVLDVEFDMGAVVKATQIPRDTFQVCTDISGAFPVIEVSVGDRDDTLLAELRVTGSREIISFDNAPKKFNYHFEILPDGREQIVETCTYDMNRDSSKDQENIYAVNTYITEFGDTVFAFDYPDTWQVETAESNEIFKEEVILKNERGVKLTYWEFNVFPLGGGGHTNMTNAEVTRVADSAIENFMVGKMQITGETDMLTGEEYSIENGSISYAVLPESYIGTHNSMVGLAGIYEECAFPYSSSQYMVLSESPDGKFSEEEEREVLRILSSFRVADNDILSETDNIFAMLKMGDFSYFAGTYKPCGIYDDLYGGGEDLEDLVLQEDGTVIGGGSWFAPDFYPETKPMEVRKQKDGSYLCQVTYSDDSLQQYFIIYPEGVIGENPYIYNDPFLTETPYIHYFSFDGGEMDIIYYKVENQ